MKRSRRSNRSDSRTRSWNPFRWGKGRGTRPADLAERAGHAGPSFEQLEERQLLFSLVVDPTNSTFTPGPIANFGSVFVDFQYFIPYLVATSEPQAVTPTTTTVDFNTNDPGNPGAFPGLFPIASGTNFGQTPSLRLDYTGANVNLQREPGQDPGGTNNRVLVGMSGGHELRFSVVDGGLVGLSLFSLDLGPNFNPNNFTVEIIGAGGILQSLTGAALAALGTPLAPPVPAGTVRYTFAAQGFTEVVIRANAGLAATQFSVDNVVFTDQPNAFSSILDDRLFGARVVFSGPIGATAQFFDLYGRPMSPTLALGSQGGNNTVPGDPDGNGIPDINDGIGRIVLSGTNGLSSFTMWGGTVEEDDGVPFLEIADSLMGIYDDFESAGFGFAIRTNGDQVSATGLPPGPGSVIIGSPFVRPLNNYNPGGSAGVGTFVTQGFNRTEQGVFLQDGSNIHSVYIHGMLFGSSRFNGFVDRIALGNLYGSVAVNGDLGELIVGGDAGIWVDDPPEGQGIIPFSARTNSQVVVGRTLGSFAAAGRSLSSVTVIGDLNSPTTRPARDVFRYYEREGVANFGAIANAEEIVTINDILASNALYAANVAFGFRFGQQQVVFGDALYRNDLIMGAEFVGSAATSVEIHGDSGHFDTINTTEDPTDVYAFPVDGTRDIDIRATASVSYMRIVDHHGRTLAALEGGAQNTDGLSVIRYRPDGPGLLYLVVHTVRAAGTNGIVLDIDYVVTISGMAPVTMGAYHTGANSSRSVANQSSVVNVLNGAIGSVRVGTGYIDGTGAVGDPADVMNLVVNTAEEETRQYLTLRTTSFSTPSHLYNITAGADINGPSFTIGGNLGTIVTGMNTGLGDATPENGDLRNTRFDVGGSIGMFDIKGGLGINTDVEDGQLRPVDADASIIVNTGLNSALRGDVGMIRVGNHAGGDTLLLRTSNGSSVGGLLISQDIGDETDRPDNGIYAIGGFANGLEMQLGINSDLRFFDTPEIDLLNQDDHTIPLIPNTTVTLTDDGGGQATLRIVGGNANAGGNVRILPISGSLGVAIGRITVNLDGGARLQITGLGPAGSTDVISLGRIIVTGSDAGSSIGISGNTQVDVWRIEQLGGDAFNEIVNTTPNGDIVAVDMVALNRLELRTGDLGRTQVGAWGPQLIGPFLGISGQQAAEVGGAITVNAAAINGFWNGGLYRPVNHIINVSPPSSWLDDIGSPVSPYLNGLIVRTGNIAEVVAGGAVGDVLATDAIADTDDTGNIGAVTANTAGVVGAGRFRGIVGNIMGNRITRVDIGDGIAKRVQSPFSSVGVFAIDDIQTVTGGRVAGAFISSTIAAGNVNVGNNTGAFPTDGIDTVQLVGGIYDGAHIAATNLDSFWFSYYAADNDVYTGDVNRVTGQGTNFLRSWVLADDITLMRFTEGFYDASRVDARSNIARIEAKGFRNTTIGGGELEFQISYVRAGGGLSVLTTTGRAGDIEDLDVEVIGRIGEVSAMNISRTSIDADNGIEQLITVNDLRGSSVTAGELLTGTIGGSVSSSRIAIAGPLRTMTVANRVTNSTFVISGPDGRLDRLTATNGFDGSVTSAGPINTIEVLNGDMRGSITTLVSQRGVPGGITLLRASRDLDVTIDAAGPIDQLVAGRHIGNRITPGTILVRGDLRVADASGGQIYSDLRVTGGVTEVVRIGVIDNRLGSPFLSRGNIIAFGRIERVDIVGDFGGQIISYSGGIGVITIDDGSLLAGGAIRAFDGNLNNVIINRGNLYGDLHADYILFSVRLNGSDDGVFGDIGVNPAFSQGTAYSNFRNQLPPGVAADSTFQGPRITAGHNIGRVILTNGSIFEATIHAQRAIGTIDVTGDITNDNVTSGVGTVIAAGSSIFLVHATGSVSSTAVIAGLRNMGEDGRPGGTGAGADSMQSGRIQTVQVDGSATGLIVVAGINAGADGIYNTGDETVTLGISYVREVVVNGNVNGVSVFADSPTLFASPGVVRGGNNLPLANTDINSGDPGAGAIAIPSGGAINFSWGGVAGTISFSTDKGQAYWNPGTGQVVLVNTTLNTQLIVSAPGTLTNFQIVSNDDASMGLVQVDSNLAGNSKIVIDAYVLRIQTGEVFNAEIRVGANVRNITTGGFHAGTIAAEFWARDIVINGSYGTTDQFGEARINALAGDTITIAGNNSALINVERDLTSLSVAGVMDRAQFRAGNTLGVLVAGGISESRVSVGDSLGAVTVSGDVFNTAIQAGGDLGADVLPGGTGEDADRSSTGTVGTVTVGGNFARSDVVAGLLRGPDGFFGTADDEAGPGRSTIGTVTVGGTQVGSNLNTQSYRVIATAGVGAVTVAGAPTTAIGNFRVERVTTLPLGIRVTDVQSTSLAQDWITRIYFNMEMNVATIGPALAIQEVRDGGTTLIPLTEGADYVVGDFDPLTNSIAIHFSRDVTGRTLPQQPGIPGPGVLRFTLDGATLRAKVENARLDGNGDGATTQDEVFSRDDVVGDAGDKLFGEIVPTPDGTELISMYPPADLDVVLDGNVTPDGLPDPNITYTVRGAIGDHPSSGVNVFSPASDTDIYKITLTSGQILRLGAMEGAGRFAGRFLLNAAGEVQSRNTTDAMGLDLTDSDFLIKNTGVYFIVVTNAADFGPGVLPQVNPSLGTIGRYNFTLQVFDDGDSGFAAGANSGNGANIVNAPPAIVFAGPDGVFGTGDDRQAFPINDYVFTLDAGPDGTPGTDDDVVSGSNSNGITSVRRNRIELTTTVEAAIGPRGHAGVPGEAAPDVDVFHLNNGLPMAAGRQVTVKVKLAELGANLGSFSQVTQADFTGSVQFGIFDVTGAQAIDDGILVFSPTDFKPVAGQPGTIAQRANMSYGFDEKGDFFITFVTPGRIGGAANEAARYAVYLQGVFNTDYVLEVSQTDTPQAFVIPKTPQNIFIETRGGVIDWLQAGGLSTNLLPFATSVLGFTGTIGGLPVDQYVLGRLVTNLQTAFTGLNVNFSTNPMAFEFQPFSTVFVTSSSDPTTISQIDNYGYSEHSDPLNLDLNDEAVVFLPSMANLGFTPSQADVDAFVQSLTAAVGRRVGELVGLRITANSPSSPNDIMSANSVFNLPPFGQTYTVPNTPRPLSHAFDSVVRTNFFLGHQNAFALLSKFLSV